MGSPCQDQHKSGTLQSAFHRFCQLTHGCRFRRCRYDGFCQVACHFEPPCEQDPSGRKTWLWGGFQSFFDHLLEMDSFLPHHQISPVVEMTHEFSQKACHPEPPCAQGLQGRRFQKACHFERPCEPATWRRKIWLWGAYQLLLHPSSLFLAPFSSNNRHQRKHKRIQQHQIKGEVNNYFLPWV